MAIAYYFFDSKLTNGQQDRTYSAQDFTNYLEGIVGSGVFPIPSDCLQVYAGTGMQVIVKPGKGWIDGHKIENDADLPLTISAADVTLNRIDRVVFRLDVTNRLMQIAVKTGTPASTPTAPALTRTSTVIEYCLAEVTVNRNVTTITEAMIRDTRADSEICGWVQGLIQQVDTSTLFKQWDTAYNQQYEDYMDQFDEWFTGIKETVASATLIRRYTSSYTTTQDNVSTIPIGISNYTNGLDILNVYINGFKLVEDYDYTLASGGNSIVLENAVDNETKIDFEILKSVDGSGAETVIGQVEQLQTTVSNHTAEIEAQSETLAGMRNSLKAPTQLFDGTHTPETSGAIKYLSIPTLSQYDIIVVRVTIGTIGEQMLYFCKGTATNGKINQSVSCLLNASTYGTATVQYDNTANQIGLRSEAVSTWTTSQIAIKKVWGIKV